MNKTVRKVVSFIAAAFIGFSTPAVANAQSNNIVMFGDSIFSNPTYHQINSNKPLISVRDDFAVGGERSPQGCAQGGINLATEMAKYTNNPIVNYSCSGAKVTKSSHKSDINEQIDHAIRTGVVNAGTSNVLIQGGFNDFMNEPLFKQQLVGPYKNNMRNNINKIKRAAPNARITMVGYPAISAPNRTACPVRTDLDFNNHGFNFDALGMFHSTEMLTNHTMWQSAVENGVRYYDLREDTKFNNICAPNSMRWVAGVYEYSKPHNMNNHLTHDGVRGVARLIVQKAL